MATTTPDSKETRKFDSFAYWAKAVDYNAKEAKNGILIDYEFCTDCHSCEIACQMEHNLPAEQWGIKVLTYGPTKNVNNKWEWINMPVFTDLCDLCEQRVAEGRLPNCVHHCQAGVMYYGTVEELAKKQTEKPKMVLYTL